MREYFKINKHKFLFQILGFGLIFSIVWTIYFVIKLNALNIEIIMFGYFISIIILPIFATCVTSLFEAIEFKMIDKIFDSEPFAQLLQSNFKKGFTANKNRLMMSKPMLIGTVENYLVNIEIERGVIRVIVDADLDKVQESNFNELKKMFGNQNVEYDVGIAILYHRAKRKTLTSEKLLVEINQFISYLKTNEINSWSNSGIA